jgi:hypothetical protein
MNSQAAVQEEQQPQPPKVKPSGEVMALREQTFTIAFETILTQLASGITLTEAIREYSAPISPIDPAHFRNWVYRDKSRKNAYLVAKAIGAEAVEDELIRISDGINPNGEQSPEDVARSTLRINTRKWLLGVWNRRRYGDVKQIEQTTTNKLDVSSLSIDELQQKLLLSLGFGAENLPDIFNGEFSVEAETGDPSNG